MTRRRLLTALSAIAILAAIVWNVQRPKTLPPTTDGQSERPRYVLREAEWVRFDEQGEARFRVEADAIEYFDDESAQLQVVQMQVPGGREPTWQIAAPLGYVPPAERRVRLSGTVEGAGVWPGGEPLTFETPSLWVDPLRHEIATDAGVVLQSASRRGRADRLRANWREHTLELGGNVRMDYARR